MCFTSVFSLTCKHCKQSHIQETLGEGACNAITYNDVLSLLHLFHSLIVSIVTQSSLLFVRVFVCRHLKIKEIQSHRMLTLMSGSFGLLMGARIIPTEI